MIDIAAEGMTAGRYYQFSYQAQNLIGVSEPSPVVTVPVADYPA